MRPKARARQKETKLPEGLEKRLGVYALAAAAAGAGMLAMAVPAKADDITLITESPALTIGARGHSTLSISSAGVLNFNDVFNQSSVASTAFARVKGLNGAKFILSNAGNYAARLSKSATIGSSASFTSAQKRLAIHVLDSFGNFHLGPWAGVDKGGYLGFEFFNSGGTQTYFGWVHLNVTSSQRGGENMSISSFAYDFCAGESIQAGETSNSNTCSQTPVNTPEPSTLALLAMGALGLFALRRKKLAGSN